jgi:hypothetical protein
MVVVSSPSDSDEVRWAFRYESNELEREDAEEHFRQMQPRNRRYKFARAVGWILGIVIILALLWAAAWVGQISKAAFVGLVTQDAIWLVSVVSTVSVYFLLFFFVGRHFRRKQNLKSQIKIEGFVQIFESREVSFVDAGITLKKKIEKVRFDKRYIFMSIEDGKRFVYLPRRVVNPEQFGALVSFIG